MEITYDPLIVGQLRPHGADCGGWYQKFYREVGHRGRRDVQDEGGEQSRVTLYLKTSRFSRQIGEMPLKTVNGRLSI